MTKDETIFDTKQCPPGWHPTPYGECVPDDDTQPAPPSDKKGA